MPLIVLHVFDGRRIVLNSAHPVVQALGRSPLDPNAVAVLVAAAVSEVNRALVSVTDADEQRALLELLARQR